MELRTPREWCEIKGLEILDPDGWRYPYKDINEAIDELEFDRRASVSTVLRRRRDMQ